MLAVYLARLAIDFGAYFNSSWSQMGESGIGGKHGSFSTVTLFHQPSALASHIEGSTENSKMKVPNLCSDVP